MNCKRVIFNETTDMGTFVMSFWFVVTTRLCWWISVKAGYMQAPIFIGVDARWERETVTKGDGRCYNIDDVGGSCNKPRFAEYVYSESPS